MEYQVPQFTEVESKIVGSLTLKQFIYLAGAAGLCITFFFYLPTIFALLFSAPIVALAAALAFYKVNGKPFIEMLEAGFNYYTGAKFFLWKRHELKTEERDTAAVTAASAIELQKGRAAQTAKLTRGKLSELAWSLDVKSGGGTAEQHEH